MASTNTFDRLWLLLKKSRPIAFGLYLAKMTGNPKAAIVLSQLAHWTRHGRDIVERNGWVFKTQQQWWVETGLSRAELDTARRRLRTLGFIEETLAGRPATLWYRLNLPNVARAPLPVELTFEFMRAPERAVRDLLGPTTAYHRVLADVTGGVNGGLLLSRLLQLQRRSLETGYPWFSLTAQTWQEDLALNRRSLDNAKMRLKELGLMQEFHLNRGAKRVYSQIDPAVLCDLLQQQFKRHAEASKQAGAGAVPPTKAFQARKLSAGPEAGAAEIRRLSRAYVQNKQAENAETENSVCDKRTLQIARGVPSSLLDSDISIGSTTTSSNTDTTTTHARGNPSATVVLRQNTVVVGSDEELIWPELLAEESRPGVNTVLRDAPAKLRQTLLDEYAAHARRRPVDNPIGYLRRLALLAQQGRFVPEMAHLEARQRSNASAVAAAVEAARLGAQPSHADAALSQSDRQAAHEHLAAIRARLTQGRAQR